MAQQTAVQFLINYMLENFHLTDYTVMVVFEQAKQMEKEQISNAMMYALDEDGHTGDWKVKFINDYIDKL